MASKREGAKTAATKAARTSSSGKAPDPVKKLKDLGEVLDTLRARRKEIKAQLGKDLRDEDESRWAEELAETSRGIVNLDEQRRTLLKKVGADKSGID